MNQLKFKSFLKEKCNINLTKEQEQVVFTVNGPIAVIAVPGSGKTTALICRTANLILNNQVNPSRILALTFSRASADDMETRFNKNFNQIIKQKIKFYTIHSFSYNVIRNYASKHNINYKIIENNISDINKNNILRNLYKKYNSGDFTTDDKIQEITNFIGFLKNMMIHSEDVEDLYSSKFPCGNFISIYNEYENIKKENFYIDFDDMLELCYSILSTNSKLLEMFIENFDYIEIDESQDVSKIQHEIIKLIMGKKCNVCLVGDPDQAIYSWRGACPETLLNFNKSYNSDAKILFMSQNFRSTKSITNVANEFIKINKARYNLDIFTNNAKGEQITLIDVENNNEQAKFIVDNIKEDNNLKECAVLFRNNITSLTIIDKLLKAEIPFYIKDPPFIFFNHWILRDILSIIKFAFNLSDINTFEKIYYKIKSYCKKTEIIQLHFQLRDDENIFESLSRTSVNEHLKIRYGEFIKKFSKLKELEPSKCIRFIRFELNYEEYIENFSKKFKYNINNIDNILKMLEILCGNIKSINELELEIKTLNNKIQNSKKFKGENVVTLTTIHSAKGMEFDKVFIMDFVDNVIPAPIDSNDKQEILSHIEEERRIAYVAITRAKNNVYILYPKVVNQQPSIFYNEIKNIIQQNREFQTNQINNKIIMQLNEGLNIKHKTFGNGYIIKKENDKISVLFEDTNKVMCLSSEVCVKNNLIHILNI
ncbi:MAG: ATP-dependent helicase [Clostridium sp.]|uniref:ATP-dependent helicase n=1 Tax=Clostridium sp. TaxID=1506 RepID=UPI003D6D6A67